MATLWQHCGVMKGKHRKPATLRKEDVIRIRVTDEQRASMQAAADKAGLDLSTWMRTIALSEAKKASEME